MDTPLTGWGSGVCGIGSVVFAAGTYVKQYYNERDQGDYFFHAEIF
jgi:hypothetical protein